MQVTEPYPRPGEPGERRFSLLMLLCAVAFALFIVWPVMEFGYNGGGDDVVHMAYNHEALAVLRSGHRLFGWSYLFGFGAPIFLFRPPLQYVCVALIHAATFGMASLNAIHKLFYVCGLAFYPASVYYLLHKLRLRPLACGLAAMLAITPVSMWGHTLDAYFRLGVAKQLIAIFVFPLALGKIHGTLINREAVLPASLLAALCFLSHPYMAYCLVLVCALYGAILLLGAGPRAAFGAGARLFAIWGLTGLLLAFYLAPFYSSPEIQVLDFSSTWRHAFEVVCMTTAQTVNCLLKGGLFDTTRWYTYGGGEWGWQDNAFTGRWPVLTALCLCGLIVCIARRRRFSHMFLMSVFLMAFVMFLGPDDVPALALLPFQEQYQYIHGIFLLDLAAVCLAGVGGAALLSLLVGIILKAPALSRKTAAVREVARVAALLLCVSFAVFMPWKDRWQIADHVILKRNFDTRGARVSPRALRHSVNSDFEKIVRLMSDPSQPGRFYGSAQGQASDRELFYFTILPALCDRTNLICGFFSAEVGGVNKTVIEQFRTAIPLYRNLVELFNVRYLVCAAANSERLQAAGAYAAPVERNPHWILWRTKGDYGHFAVVPGRPLLVWADRREWTGICRLWLDAFKDTPLSERFPYLVAARPGAVRDGELNVSRYAGLIVLGGERRADTAELRNMARFAAAGGRILSQAPLEGIPHEHVRAARDIDFDSLISEEQSPGGTCRETVVERERHAAGIALDRPAFVMFKTAYYRGWRAEADGACLDTFEVGPGFNAVFLPEGEHELVFRYRGPNCCAAGNAVSIAALIGAVACTLAARRRKRRADLVSADRPGAETALQADAIRRPYLLAAVLLLALAALARLYVKEQFLNIPVPIRPASGENVPTDIRLDWNPLEKTNATYEVEIDEDSPDFKRVVYHREGLNVAYARKQFGLRPGRRHWWHVRSVYEGRQSPWSRPISFTTAPAPDEKDASEPFYIDPGCTLTRGGRIAVEGRSNLPDGAHLYVRVCRADTLERLCSTEARVIDGRFKALVPVPDGGWPRNAELVLHCDCGMITQEYPAAAELGERGEAFAATGTASSHRLLRGLFAKCHAAAADDAVNAAANHVNTLTVRGLLSNFGELKVDIEALLPDHAMLTVQIMRECRVDPVAHRHVEVLDGRAEVTFDVQPGADYGVVVRLSPDMQYGSLRRILGEEGEHLPAQGEDGHQFGLRRVLSLSDLAP